jgi:general secretion pathway protein M
MDMQRLLYDLEAGMPFLFVDELTAEMPQSVGARNDGLGRMHVQLAVSGEWQKAAR